MSQSESASVLLEATEGAVRFITLNRPARKNALTDELGWAILAAFERAAHDDAVRAIGLTGAGDAFCSGADLAPSPTDSPLAPADRAVDDLGWVGRFPLAIRIACEKPVVAGINGVAVGAGLSLAMCADIRIASSAARQTKRLVTRAGLMPDLESLLRDEMSYVFRGLSSEDGREAVRAILEKRAPRFQGR